ncbi:PH domain-containing protein [Clostridium sp. Marseille-Q2269]|uniref:PH domain-containing protein n=1 Tax=Clostridium sp. Marseille-Q2269 TaxID=2942205 RepID=UPI0020747C81|nr:PH domain-containing protein [Clostridium sp. Marseille-Q2269]
MISKPMRNHFLYIIKNIINFIKSSLFLIVLLLVKMSDIRVLLGVLAVVSITIIYIVLSWRKIIFYIKDGMLVSEKGIISKSKQEIPFDKINTIDSTQSVLDRIFKVYTLKIDTGSVGLEKTEFKVIVKYEILEQLRNTILGSTEEEFTHQHSGEHIKGNFQHSNLEENEGLEEKDSLDNYNLYGNVQAPDTHDNSDLDMKIGTKTQGLHNKLDLDSKGKLQGQASCDDSSLDLKRELVTQTSSRNNDNSKYYNGNDKFTRNSKFNKKEEPINKKVITGKEIFKYATTKSKILWSIGGFFAMYNSLDDIVRHFDMKIPYIYKYINLNSIQTKSVFILILGLIVFMAFIYMVMVIGSVIFEMIRLNNFTVETYRDKISISYGALDKKKYSFKLNKIYGIKYKQSILQQLMKIGTIELITIGYGDEKDEKAILYPIVDKKSKDEFIRNVLPDMIFEGDRKVPPKKSKIRFIIRNFIIWTVIILPIYILLKIVPINIKLTIVIFTSVLVLIYSLLDYKNTSLGTSKDVLIVSRGGFTKVTTTIRESNMQSITKKQSPFQKKAGISTYIISLYTNELGDSIKVKYMDNSLYNKIQENIKF